jgi:hypothetical protein
MALTHYAQPSLRSQGRTIRVARFDGSVSGFDVSPSTTMPAGGAIMIGRRLAIIGAALVALVLMQVRIAAQSNTGPYARIAMLRPHDGDTVDFEAGYLRHLEFHRQAKDSWVWYGWSIWAGERQRWFVYATFGHSAESFDHPVPPAEDERDNVSNVTPHAEFTGNALYEFLPALSRGNGVPTPAPRVEMTTVDVAIGSARTFEAALAAAQSTLQDETLWYRMVAGGPMPRYLRLRPRSTLAALVAGQPEQSLPEKIHTLVTKTTIEILNLRPAMSYGLPAARP